MRERQRDGERERAREEGERGLGETWETEGRE